MKPIVRLILICGLGGMLLGLMGCKQQQTPNNSTGQQVPIKTTAPAANTPGSNVPPPH